MVRLLECLVVRVGTGAARDLLGAHGLRAAIAVPIGAFGIADLVGRAAIAQLRVNANLAQLARHHGLLLRHGAAHHARVRRQLRHRITLHLLGLDGGGTVARSSRWGV